jgi:hypothetical protein
MKAKVELVSEGFYIQGRTFVSTNEYKVTHGEHTFTVQGKYTALKVGEALELGVPIKMLVGLGGLNSLKKCKYIIKYFKKQ